MCSGNDENNETDFETLVTKLMNIDGDPGMMFTFYKFLSRLEECSHILLHVVR